MKKTFHCFVVSSALGNQRRFYCTVVSALKPANTFDHVFWKLCKILKMSD